MTAFEEVLLLGTLLRDGEGLPAERKHMRSRLAHLLTNGIRDVSVGAELRAEDALAAFKGGDPGADELVDDLRALLRGVCGAIVGGADAGVLEPLRLQLLSDIAALEDMP